jgi:tetratricopeptide (TPR) repeat protein
MSKRPLWICATIAAIALVVGVWRYHRSTAAPTFTQVMTRANGLLEKGDAPAAIALYAEALQLSPTSTDVRLNLVNAYLAAGQPDNAVPVCREVIELDHNGAAAYYLLGCALLRQNQPEAAAAAFQQSWKIEPGVPALDFQMGMAQQQLGQDADAIRDFENVVRAVPDHPSAHFQLSQLYRRAGRADDAARELQEHQRLSARSPTPITASALERCRYTQPIAPFVLAQPEPRGIPVHFVDDTTAAFGGGVTQTRGPLAIIDYDHDGRLSLLAHDVAAGLVVLDNHGGHFAPLGRPVRVPANAHYRVALAGDVDNDGFDDVIVLGEQDSRLVKFYAHGQIRDATRAAGLEGVKATAGVLADLNFTGNLDLAVVHPAGAGLGLYRNLGNLYFDSNWNDSGLEKAFPNATALTTEDWGNEGLPGLFITRKQGRPEFYAKQRAAAFTPSRLTEQWPAGAVMALGDIDNDLRPEAVISSGGELTFIDWKQSGRPNLPLSGSAVTGLTFVDFDNDGWLDLIAYGPGGLRVWRNAGQGGFVDVTRELGLEKTGAVEGIVSGDFDADGDTDLVTWSESGLRLWRNDGGNRNLQLKLRLTGNRSNRSSLGVRVEVAAGDWRTSRTVQRVPLEIGVGQHARLDAIRVHWFDLSTAQVDVPVTKEGYAISEPTLPSGSCPYLYAWDGKQFTFVTDVLGAAPLGLPVNEKMFVPADPEELLVLGNEARFPVRNGRYEIRLTDELREVLYLDEAHLIAVDHPPGTLVYPTSKMHPGGPFPPHELWTLHPLGTPKQATRSDGLDVTAALAQIDQQMVSPVKLRRPQLRGLAEPFSVTLDFGPLPVTRPLVLALTGWLHFGGGMANIAGSIDPTLPFPFPVLEAELGDGSWQKVNVDVGTPAGKTKTILVDLENKLPAGTRRLRLSMAYEMYWDCAQLCEKAENAAVHRHDLLPDRTDLHWRGYSRYADLPSSLPLTAVYSDVSPTPPWDRTPSGWFTRYGAVGELVAQWDDQQVLLAGGDELALSFDAAKLPPLAPGMQRDFFLHLVGWDKDADFHVEQGWRLEPLPFRGMDDQAYGKQPRPSHLPDAWIKTYNTRWVAPEVVSPGGRMRQIP